jgi:transposase
MTLKRPPLDFLLPWTGRTRVEIAAHFGVSRQTVDEWVKFYGLEVRAQSHPTDHITAEMLQELAGLPVPEIVARLGLSESTVYHLYRRHGVERVRGLRMKKTRWGHGQCPCVHQVACREAEQWGGQAPCETLIDADDKLRAQCAGKYEAA